MTRHQTPDWTFLERPQEIAEQVRRGHGITTLPVPVAAIAQAEGATIQYVPLASEGALAHTSSGYILKVNEAATSTRRRYTIAHEVGHILCDRLTGTLSGTRYRSSDNNLGIREEERFCQRFAACLLIPDESIAAFAKWEDMSIEKLQEKARELQVSSQALIWRVLERLPNEGGAICFRIMGKPNDLEDMKLRVDWNVFPKTVKKYIARYDSVPQDSPIQRALTHQRTALYEDVKVDFGSLRGKRNLLVKSVGGSVLAIVLPVEVDPLIFKCAAQVVAEGI